jgi:DNA invertase Pin-like site-specific DNA recombinase
MSVANIYCRISANNDHSLDGQKRDCIKYCKDNNLTVNKIYVETSSARDGDNYETLKGIIEATPENGTIIVSSICRFSRNMLKALQILHKMEKKKIKIHCVNENITYDDVHSRFSFRNHLNHAQYESDLISDRVKRSKKRRRIDKFGEEDKIIE